MVDSVSPPAGLVKKRDSNIEAFRILAMLSIVAHHYVVNSGVMDCMAVDTFNLKAVFYYVFGMWGKTGINCFVLITGWYMCRSEITLRKFLKLYGEIVFYNLVFFLIFLFSGYTQFSIKDLFFCVFPITGMNDSFIPAFLVFFLFIPFLSILVRNMNLCQHGLLVLLCITGYTIMGSIPWFHVSYNYVIWFGVLFLVASYLRIYGGEIPLLSKLKWGLFSILSIMISIGSVIAIVYLGRKEDGLPYFFVADSNKILALITSVCLFMYFKKMKISYHKWINVVASSTFAVLLIHANCNAMRQWLWKDVVDVQGHYFKDEYWLFSVCVVLLVFITCVLIDQILKRLIEVPIERFFQKKLD